MLWVFLLNKLGSFSEGLLTVSVKYLIQYLKAFLVGTCNGVVWEVVGLRVNVYQGY